MESSFHSFPNLPLTLQTSILNHALSPHPLLISAFWTLDPTGKSHILHLPTTPSFKDLQSIAQLNDPFLDIVPVRLKCTIDSRHFSSSPYTHVPTREEIIFMRPKKDILYLPFLESASSCATLNVAHFISCEENQRIKHIAIAHHDFELQTSRFVLDRNRISAIEQLIYGLKNLETLYVLEGDTSERLLSTWRTQPGRVVPEDVPFARLGEVEVEMVTVEQVNKSVQVVAGAVVVRESTWRGLIAGVRERGNRMMLQLAEMSNKGEHSRRTPLREVSITN
ncbi:hypothetical protein V8E51_011549 [Hyaloscypha variabilis]